MLILRQFLLLLWKGFKLRLRHFIITGFEMILPILALCFILYLQSAAGFGGLNTKYPPETYKENKIEYRNSNGVILYTPNSTEAKKIVDMILPLNPNGWTAMPMKDENELSKTAADMDDYHYNRKSPLGLVFEDLGFSTFTLKYKIKTNNFYDVQMKYSPYLGLGDYIDGYGTNFLPLQSAVDGAFFNLSIPNAKSQSPYMSTERFLQFMPYPAHYDSSLSILWFVPMLSNVTFVFMAVVFVKRMVDEKANRAKELMRMMGLNDFVYFAGNWLVCFIPMALIFSLAMIIFKIPVGMYSKSILHYSSGFMVWLILLLYAANSLLFCMVISTFFNRPVLASIVTFILWLLTYTLPSFLIDLPGPSNKYDFIKRGPKLAACLLPNAGLHFAFKIIAFFESTGDGSTWSNGSTPLYAGDLSLSMVIGMMVASIVIYCFVIWYVDNVWPWQFGIPKHPAFFLMPSYWMPRKAKLAYSFSHGDVDSPDVDKSYFEEEPQGKIPGVTVNNLTKSFGWGSSRKVAVNDVSLNMFHGEITALLGHNGAGKTTTLNIITGLFPPSSGSAIVNGYSVLDNAKQARRSLGLCPQHNVLYDNLTVAEHLTLFAGLKGRTFAEINAEITSCLDFLQLQNKRNDLARTLSGGMKRKLSLGIAMIGGSEVLILDEPTSGMDPQARRAIWDLLNHIKQTRTIVLTTHYMEEADILGDRIAIMAEGVVQCFGSPHFLKKKFGAGYHLRVSKGEKFQPERLLDVIQSNVPSAYVDSDMRTEISYVLPVAESQPFVTMFESLEKQKDIINYTACGLTITTMEDVFIKVGQLVSRAQDMNGAIQENTTTTPGGLDFMIPASERQSGFALWLQQFLGLLVKRFHDSKRYLAFLVFLLVLPLAITFVMLYIRNTLFQNENSKPLPLDLRAIYGETDVYYRNLASGDQELVDKLKSVYNEAGASAQLVSNLTDKILSVGDSNLQYYKTKLIVAANLTQDPETKILKATAVFSKAAYHSSALSLNLMNVALLRAATKNDQANIKITNAPFPSKHTMQSFVDPLVRLIISIFLPLALSFLSASFVLFPIHERQTKSKLIQLMTGVDGLTFWGTHFVWDFGMHLLASCFMLIPFAVMDTFGAYGPDTGALGVLFLMLMLYGWSSIPLSYLMSFISKKPSTGFVVVTFINFITGMITTLAVTIYKLTVSDRKNVVDNSETVAWFLRILPSFAMTWGTANLDVLARTRAECSKDQSSVVDPSLPRQNCELGLGSFDAGATGRDMLFMFLSGLIFFFILASLETNLVRFWYRLRDAFKGNKVAQPAQNPYGGIFPLVVPETQEDSDVAYERTRVDQLLQQNQAHTEALVVNDLSKNFGNINAVHHVTFSVHHDECFGLLGVNGAGKTTTFSMLTGDLTIGEGTAMIGHCSLREDLRTFQRQIGYCPQFDALLDRLTGRESLYLFARLRGVPEKDIPRRVNSLIGVVDLQKHADKTADKYSGGNRRKLSLALSLIGSPPVVFLDEPTAGVDPASRRNIWNAFMQVQRTGGTSFILTTHSMEECEALCGRLVIMVNGEFRCLGPIQYLKTKFGQGYTIIVKLDKKRHLDPQATMYVQQFFTNTFPGCILKDIHEGMLHYHIVDTRYTWSHLFREMEQAKTTFNLEDYLISDTTLEQIFLAFARTQRIVAAS